MKKIFKFIKNIIKLFFTILCILLVTIILVQRFSNNEITVLGYRIFNVATGSMVPKYNIGDILLVKAVDVATLEKYDDITYLGKEGSFAGRVVTHQIVEIEKDKNGERIYHTKGIANNDEDPTIKAGQIYGKVIYKFRVITWFSTIVNNMYGMYILLIGSILIVIILEIRDYKKIDEDEEIEDTKENEKDKPKVNKMRERRKKRQQMQNEKEK